MSRQQGTKNDKPSEKQLEYASSLGIEVPRGAAKWEVTRLLNREILKRGRRVLRAGLYTVYTGVKHPVYGECEIVRIGEKTLKVTLESVDDGRKHVINAMYLEECVIID
jgi:hypothetical protein